MMKSIIMGPVLVKRVKARGIPGRESAGHPGPPLSVFPDPERSLKIIRAFTPRKVYNGFA